MKKKIGENIDLYTNTEFPEIVIIFSHGLSEGRNSDFIKNVSQELTDNSKKLGVITHDFDFLTKKNSPSDDLSVEVENLSKVVKLVKKELNPDRIVLVGKSLGGVVSLKYITQKKDDLIDKIFILGLPLKLGFPPRIPLLREKNPILPDYKSEYLDILENIKNEMVIIQGNRDDLCDVSELKTIISGYGNIKILVIPGANHGFVDVDSGDNLHAKCVKSVIKNLNIII